MTRGKTKLEAEATSKGFDKVAGDAKKVDEALGGVQETTAQSSKTAEKAAGAQKKLNASTEDYTSLLSRIHPALGAMADAAVKGGRVMGDFATQQISLRGALDKARQAIRANASALKLLGAAGAAAAAVGLLVTVVLSMRDAFKAAKEEIRRYVAAQEEHLAKVRDLEKAYTAAANARNKFEAIGREEAEAGTKQARRIASKYGIDEGAAASIAGELAGVEVDEETRAAYTAMRASGLAGVGGLDPKLPEHVRRNRVEAQVRRNREWWESYRQDVAEQKGRGRQEAYKQWRSDMGPTPELREFAKTQFPDLPEEDIAKLAEQARSFGSLEGFRRSITESSAPWWDPRKGARGVRQVPTEDPGWIPGSRERIGMTPVDEARMDRLLNALEQLVKGGGTPTHVHHGGRYYSLGDKARRDAITNGEGMRTAWEGN